MNYINTDKLSDSLFVKNFEKRVNETIDKFKLFNKNQKILIAASGGKDSTVLLYLMKKLGYKFEAVTVNAHIGCYSDESLENLRNFCSENGIKLNEISLRREFGNSLCSIMKILEEKGLKKTSCSVCGTLRRYLLNKYSEKSNADVILTGHNLDDEANGILVSLFSGNLKHVARLGPLVSFKEFVSKAKPLYFCFENEVERYSKLHKFNVKYAWCPCSEKGARRFYSELNINPEKKFNLVKNTINNIPNLKRYYKSDNLKKCVNCDSPCSNSVCQTCKILSTVKDIHIENERLCN